MKLSVVVSVQPASFAAATFKGDLAQNIELIATMGYDGVELAIRDPCLVNDGELERIISACKLAVPAIGTGQAWGEEGLSLTDPDPEVRASALARLKSHLPLAARFNAVVIIGLLRGIVKPGVSYEQAMHWLVSGLEECCAAALQEGVRLAVEPINRYETSLINTVVQGLELIERVGAPNLGLLLDTFHMNIEEPSLEASICKASERIFHFHVADSNRWYPGAGHLDFTRILNVLFETGYAGFVSGEFLPQPDAETAARRAIAYLRALHLG